MSGLHRVQLEKESEDWSRGKKKVSMDGEKRYIKRFKSSIFDT